MTHKREDEFRKRSEKTRIEIEQRKVEALNKLTSEERKLLGLK